MQEECKQPSYCIDPNQALADTNFNAGRMYPFEYVDKKLDEYANYDYNRKKKEKPKW